MDLGGTKTLRNATARKLPNHSAGGMQLCYLQVYLACRSFGRLGGRDVGGVEWHASVW